MSTPPVDWELAARLAPRLVRSDPACAHRADREHVVESLRAAGAAALPHAARVTGLATSTDPQILVVDCGGWTRANVRALAAATGAPDNRRGTIAAVELAGALALMSGSVLGQVEPWAQTQPRLLLVAPNVLATERSLAVPAEDFRLWVALHEQTHVLQFTAAPWLAGYLAARVSALWTDQPRIAPTAMARGVGRLAHGQSWSPVELLDERLQSEMDQIGAVMSLLEGYADVAMDAVGTDVIAGVRELRRRFGRRRAAGTRASGLRKTVRTLLGVDMKMAQYADGAAFVRSVRRHVGWDGLNAVWSSEDLLPRPEEIANPASWVRRVHG